jgi:putative tryptophan/tyrosine transport system substrate-binding protein
LATMTALRRDGGNVTGISLNAVPLAAKRLEFLRALMPDVSKVAILVNSAGPLADAEKRDIAAAARDAGLELLILTANSASEIEPAFSAASGAGVHALVIGTDPMFSNQRNQIVALAQRHAMHVVYPWREYVEAGGLMSYGPRLSDAYHELGRYAGRILNGAAPADLPVQVSRKFELVINLETAKTLGLSVPRLLLARADAVVE